MTLESLNDKLELIQRFLEDKLNSIQDDIKTGMAEAGRRMDTIEERVNIAAGNAIGAKATAEGNSRKISDIEKRINNLYDRIKPFETFLNNRKAIIAFLGFGTFSGILGVIFSIIEILKLFKS